MSFSDLSHVLSLSGGAALLGTILWGAGVIIGRLFPDGIAAAMQARSTSRAIAKACQLADTDPSTAVAILSIVHGMGGAQGGYVALPKAQDQPPDGAAGSPP